MNCAIDQEHFNLMKKVCYKNLRTVCKQDEMDSLIYFTYVKCSKQYDKTKSLAKFTTYLYQSIDHNSRKLYLKTVRSKEKSKSSLFFDSASQPLSGTHQETFEILESVKSVDEESYKILVQKFLYGMTNVEIGKENGYCRESARKKVKKALSLCRELCIID